MPIYAYRCPEGHEFDDIRSIAEGSGAPCPTCGAEARRVPPTEAPSVSFRGHGWTPTFHPGRKHK